MNFAAFKHAGLLRTESFSQFYMYVGKAYSISRQKSRQHTLDRVGRRRNLHDPTVSAPKDLSVFSDGFAVGQYAAAIREELLAFWG
jgi:hypothetical protein